MSTMGQKPRTLSAADLLRADQANPPIVRRPWCRIIDRQHGGDPFVTHFEVDGREYLLDESYLIESFELAAQRMAKSLVGGGGS